MKAPWLPSVAGSGGGGSDVGFGVESSSSDEEEEAGGGRGGVVRGTVGSVAAGVGVYAGEDEAEDWAAVFDL